MSRPLSRAPPPERYMPLSTISSLYKIALDRQKLAETDENEKKRQEAEAVEEGLEEMMDGQ